MNYSVANWTGTNYSSRLKYYIITPLILFLTMNMQAQDWEGTWKGVLVAGPQKLNMVFHIKKDAAGNLSATMDSPDQLAYDIKMDKVSVTDGEITMDFTAGHAQYIGKLNEDKSGITGNWVQGVPLPLNLEKTKTAEGPQRPQEPKGPFPYKIEEVTYENKKADGIKLAGTLTIPEGEGKHPVVLLISGSGPQDRDESILKHKPFWVLADYLTRNGVAVLRVDDRGVGASEGNFATATSADFASDVAAGVAFLRAHASIDVNKIGLMGHSEGGLIAPMVAAKDKKLGFIVLLAGPGVAGHELLLQQNEDIMRQKGLDENLITSLGKINSKIYQTILEDKKNTKNANDFLDAIKDELAAMSEEDKKTLGLEESALRQSFGALTSPWMRYFIRSVPNDNLKKVKCPVLALNGEKDLQVAGKINLEAIEASLKQAKNKNFKCELLPNLNHLFQTAETGAVEEYVTIEETFSPDAMKLILDWIKAN